MEEILKGEITFFRSARLPGERVAHAFLARTGGVSPPPFDSLNFAVKVGDTPGNVKENMARAAGALDLPLDKTVTVRQVHGSRVAVVDGAGELDPSTEADAVLTGAIGVPVGVLTADCLPVLLYDPVNGAVGAIHAGWRGTVGGVAAVAVANMRESFGSEPREIRAAFGPRIGPCCYSVNSDVLVEFESAFGPKARKFFTYNGELKCDLAEANKELLIRAGLEHMDTVGPCTACDTARFFSYRKEAGAYGETGRLLSFIMLK
jgi:YfiH family protein